MNLILQVYILTVHEVLKKVKTNIKKSQVK